VQITSWLKPPKMLVFPFSSFSLFRVLVVHILAVKANFGHPRRAPIVSMVCADSLTLLWGAFRAWAFYA